MRTTRKLDASAKRKKQGGGGRGAKKNRGAVDIFENIEFPVSPETENSHWLKGGKSVMTLTTADHDCLQAGLAVRSSCHCCVLRWIDNLLERSLERFPNVSSLKDEQKEAVRHLLCSKDVVGILPTGAGCYGKTNARRWESCCSCCSGTTVKRNGPSRLRLL